MGKTSKKAAVAGTRSITDFFSRNSASLPPQRAKSLSTQENVTSISSATSSVFTSSDASSPATPCSSCPFRDPVEIVPPGSAMKSQYLVPPSFPALKRAGSNSPRAGSLSPHPTPGKSRNPVFDSDSDPEKPAPSVYVIRSPPPAEIAISAPAPLRATENLTSASQIKTNPRKRQRLWSPEPCSELVPTSQSDEMEIASVPSLQRDPIQVKRNVEEWRNNTASADSPLEKASFNVPSLNVQGSPSSNDAIPSIPPLPSTPPALDPTTKAERIIAEIRARAYAATLQNRPETPVREFKDELSDSDDDVFPESPIKGKGKAVATKLQTSASERYTLRTREASPSPSAPKKLSRSAASTTRSRVASTRVPVPLSTQNLKGKGKNWNPLDDLLKEKKRNDQRGKGFEAFRQAEAALANRDAIMFDAGDEDFTDEAAARKAVTERSHLTFSPGGYDASESDDEVNEHDPERLLGEKHGKAVVSLLNRDKASRQKDKEIEKPVGVPLWHVNEDAMDVEEETLPKLDITKSHPILTGLQGALDRNDITQAALLISSGIISSVHMAESPAFISYLCDLALLAEGTALSRSAMQALTQLWGNSSHSVPGISFACILATLARLGPQPNVLDAMGWTVPTTNTTFVPPNKRESMLYRLTALVNTSARFRRLFREEIPDILLAMVLVANDPTSSAELQCEIVLAIHAVCGSIASGCDISASLESTVCTKLLKYLSTSEPVNKAYIIGLFGSGCGRTRRIGRWIAHSVITDKLDVSPQRYSDLPPILPLLEELTRQRSATVDSPGKFEQHGKTDFVDMAFYVRILGVAITNIEGYVKEERKAPRPRRSSSANATSSTQPQEPPLVLLQTAIETLHARISDIRAMHLDRSRTKAALKELSLRIYYQRQVAQQSFRTLHTYFSKNKKPTGDWNTAPNKRLLQVILQIPQVNSRRKTKH
ncbi:hypothetical protein E4T56_gene9334 [Termitomyces sp. T112]|nr:hypothetical protein E4T56_gene9334 [Termitomyces sp. T112]